MSLSFLRCYCPNKHEFCRTIANTDLCLRFNVPLEIVRCIWSFCEAESIYQIVDQIRATKSRGRWLYAFQVPRHCKKFDFEHILDDLNNECFASQVIYRIQFPTKAQNIKDMSNDILSAYERTANPVDIPTQSFGSNIMTPKIVFQDMKDSNKVLDCMPQRGDLIVPYLLHQESKQNSNVTDINETKMDHDNGKYYIKIYGFKQVISNTIHGYFDAIEASIVSSICRKCYMKTLLKCQSEKERKEIQLQAQSNGNENNGNKRVDRSKNRQKRMTKKNQKNKIECKKSPFECRQCKSTHQSQFLLILSGIGFDLNKKIDFFYKQLLHGSKYYNLFHFIHPRYIVDKNNMVFRNLLNNDQSVIKKIPRKMRFELSFYNCGNNCNDSLPIITKVYLNGIDLDSTMELLITPCKMSDVKYRLCKMKAIEIFVKNANWEHNIHHSKLIEYFDRYPDNPIAMNAKNKLQFRNLMVEIFYPKSTNSIESVCDSISNQLSLNGECKQQEASLLSKKMETGTADIEMNSNPLMIAAYELLCLICINTFCMSPFVDKMNFANNSPSSQSTKLNDFTCKNEKKKIGISSNQITLFDINGTYAFRRSSIRCRNFEQFIIFVFSR